ncbi:hypothetical protein Scep_022840 [Stephania cephalantha]|uniref:FAD-binding PCMH-type domain-containing protein n=1 Tax=Stephania cephalantha TaxID=152367 RepID=A0AAP0F659_9MAGN
MKSKFPFPTLDLINFRFINIDVYDQMAWVHAGATLGLRNNKVVEKTKRTMFGFTAWISTTVSAGGYFSGGGAYGSRKTKLAQVPPSVTVFSGSITLEQGAISLVQKRIRSGGHDYEGLSYTSPLTNTPFVLLDLSNLNSIDVDIDKRTAWVQTGATIGQLYYRIAEKSLVHAFAAGALSRTLEEGATDLVHKWQYIAYKLPKDLALFASLAKANASNTTTTSTGQASFQALFLGGTTELLEIMQENFSELGLKREDCIEMSWIQSVLFFAGLPTTNVSLNAFEANILLSNFKGASDYVKQPISKTGLQGIWRNIVQMSSTSILQLQAYGGRMSEISDTSIPFPHRAGNTYKILYLVNNDNNIEELRRLYKYMTPYVSKSPRAAYLNARDLDLGHNEMWTNYTPSYEEAKIWGSKYFKNNFDRLVKVKSRIDPDNFFRNEQSIPPSFT